MSKTKTVELNVYFIIKGEYIMVPTKAREKKLKNGIDKTKNKF